MQERDKNTIRQMGKLMAYCMVIYTFGKNPLNSHNQGPMVFNGMILILMNEKLYRGVSFRL